MALVHRILIICVHHYLSSGFNVHKGWSDTRSASGSKIGNTVKQSVVIGLKPKHLGEMATVALFRYDIDYTVFVLRADTVLYLFWGWVVIINENSS